MRKLDFETFMLLLLTSTYSAESDESDDDTDSSDENINNYRNDRTDNHDSHSSNSSSNSSNSSGCDVHFSRGSSAVGNELAALSQRLLSVFSNSIGSRMEFRQLLDKDVTAAAKKRSCERQSLASFVTGIEMESVEGYTDLGLGADSNTAPTAPSVEKTSSYHRQSVSQSVSLAERAHCLKRVLCMARTRPTSSLFLNSSMDFSPPEDLARSSVNEDLARSSVNESAAFEDAQSPGLAEKNSGEAKLRKIDPVRARKRYVLVCCGSTTFVQINYESDSLVDTKAVTPKLSLFVPIERTKEYSDFYFVPVDADGKVLERAADQNFTRVTSDGINMLSARIALLGCENEFPHY